MTATPSNLASLATAVLEYAAELLGARAPDRQYIQAGQVSIDDRHQLTVSWAPSGIYSTSDQYPNRVTLAARNPQVPLVDILVLAVRPVPSLGNDAAGELYPAAEDIQDAAMEIMADAEILYCGLVNGARKGDLVGGCKLVGVSGVAPYGPQGGVGGSQITLTLQYGCTSPAS